MARRRSFLAGCSALARGDNAAAEAQFELARPAFESDVREAPDNAERHANLGLLYAFLGRKPMRSAKAAARSS